MAIEANIGGDDQFYRGTDKVLRFTVFTSEALGVVQNVPRRCPRAPTTTN